VKGKKVVSDKIKKQNKDRSRRGEYLSFCDIEKLMQHDSYRRVKGAIRRARWGKMNLKDISTKKLVEELKSRKGIETTIVEPYAEKIIKANGPAIVFVVID